MHRFPALLLGLGVVSLLLVGTGLTDAFAEANPRFIDEIGIKRHVVTAPLAQRASGFSTSQADTIWVGYTGVRTAANPYGVGMGGVWDFELDAATTDTTQFWDFHLLRWRSESTTALPTPAERPMWYFDHGNEVNRGNTNLWLDRESRGLVAQNKGPAQSAGYIRQGIMGYWHSDTMTGVSSPISGTKSAWCGLRAPSDFTYLDDVTGNPLNADLTRYWNFGGAAINRSYPGYGDQIDQILYRDVTLQAGTNTLLFRMRTDMSDLAATENGGSAWFQPDPTTGSNLVLSGVPGKGPIDSLMVWVGLPQDGNYYDANKRWLSEVINFDSASQPKKLFAQHGKAPLVGNDTTVTVTFDAADYGGAGTTVRLAFQVKTNRSYSDGTYDIGGYDSVEGAALIDDVLWNAGAIGLFENDDDIRARYPLPGGGVLGTENSPSTYWIKTGKPPAAFSHVDNIIADGLPYADPCGALGSPDRICNLIGNVIMLSNHDDPDHAFYRESWSAAESPTINIANGSPIQNALDANGFDLMRIEYNIWSGDLDIEEATFYNVGARYHGPTFVQQADDLVPSWSDNLCPAYIAYWPDPICNIEGPGEDLDGIIPPPSQLDSLKVFVWTQTRCARFGATVLCGKPEGGYFDDYRVGFTGGGGSAITAQFWDLLADTFPFNEDIAPGSVDFDTTTALIKQALNNAASSGGEGVIIGDSLAVSSPFISGAGQPTRLDLVFRILPGPGNYSVKGDKSSALWKVPSNPGLGVATPGDGSFFGEYLAANGLPFGKGNHNAGWDPTTWNSARMDSSDNGNISPLVGREIGIPVDDTWEGTYHESDPIGGTGAPLAITKNLCFLVDPTGTVNELNVCCSAAACAAAPFFESWPPSAYSGRPTTTQEHTKIIPDGIFTPGSHIEYFMRRSDAPAGVAAVGVVPDTTLASQQPALGPFFDGQRFLEIGVFPDMWKDQRFGGDGLACMLVFDGADRRGQEDVVIGTLDSLGYGKNNGAGRGWWEDEWSTTQPDPDDPSNWVFPNLGQKGLAFDWFDIQASESDEGDRPGCRINDGPIDLQDRQCKQGPTPAMLKNYYNTILFAGGDNEAGVIHDGVDSQQQSDDVALFQDFLATSAAGSERAVYFTGDGIANDLANSLGNAPTLLTNYFAATLVSIDYRTASNNLATPSAVQNLIPEFNTPRWYGYNNSCVLYPDVIAVNGGVAGGVLAQRWEDSSDGDASINPGVYGAAVYRPADNVSRYYTTLLTGYQMPNLRGVGFENVTDDAGRQAFVSDALAAFDLCSAVGPVIAVGDLPGAQGAQLNFVRGAFPNPSISGLAKINFSLAQPAKVTFRFYNVAGRLVHEESVDYASGGPKVYNWNGQTSTGMRTAPGVYFYRLSAPGVEFQNNSQRMVLLGGN